MLVAATVPLPVVLRRLRTFGSIPPRRSLQLRFGAIASPQGVRNRSFTLRLRSPLAAHVYRAHPSIGLSDSCNAISVEFIARFFASMTPRD